MTFHRAFWLPTLPILLLLGLEGLLGTGSLGVWELPIPALVSRDVHFVVLFYLTGLSGYLMLKSEASLKPFWLVPLVVLLAFLPLAFVTVSLFSSQQEELSRFPRFLIPVSGAINLGIAGLIFLLRYRQKPFLVTVSRALPGLLIVSLGLVMENQGDKSWIDALLALGILFPAGLSVLEFRRQVTNTRSQKLNSVHPDHLRVYKISDREAEVARLAATGRTNQEIAAALFISLSTVKTHLASLFAKTGTRNRVEMITRLSNQTFGG